MRRSSVCTGILKLGIRKLIFFDHFTGGGGGDDKGKRASIGEEVAKGRIWGEIEII